MANLDAISLSVYKINEIGCAGIAFKSPRMRSVLTLETYIFTRDCASETQKQPGNAIHRDQRRASRPLESALPDHHIAATSTRPLYRHTQAQHEAAQGGTWRRPSAADTARCSDAHECMHTAMSSCSGPQHTAAEASRDAHDANKKAPSMPTAPLPPAHSALRARPRRPQCWPL